MAWKMLPPAPDRCPICAVDHAHDEPHDAQSVYYQMRFRAAHGRYPTWADALAHCAPEVRASWEAGIRKMGIWSEPEAGQQAIADPPAESFHQVVEAGHGPTVIDMSE